MQSAEKARSAPKVPRSAPKRSAGRCLVESESRRWYNSNAIRCDRSAIMNRKQGIKIWAIVFWLAVWEILSRLLDKDIFLVGPVRVVVRLFELLPSGGFWASIGFSLLRITCGYLVAVVLGVALAAASRRYERVRELLAPIITVMKSVPVASFIILALICLPPRSLSVLISFLIAMPVVYMNAYEGLGAADPGLLEMTKVFGTRRGNVIRAVYIPALYPYLAAACRTAVGMAWKAGTAAEVIGIPRGSIGEKLQQAKIYLETPDLFAWTLVIVLLSALSERLFHLILKRGYERLTRIPGPKRRAAEPAEAEPKRRAAELAEADGESARSESTARSERAARADRAGRAVFPIEANGLTKSYDGVPVIKDFSHLFPVGSVTAVMAPSGAGKTTLLRLIAGLEQPDGGTVRGAEGISMVFQEDRLCDALDAASNVMLARDGLGREDAEVLLAEFGLAEDPEKRLSEYSGGMRRRVALARALAADYDILLLDEPFKGLDPELRATCAEKILEASEGKTVILVTHDASEAELMNCGEVIALG